MRRFLYFIAGLDGSANRETVIRAAPALAYAFPAGMSFQTRGIVGGALGNGCLCAAGDSHDMRYNAEAQEWRQIAEQVHLGLPRDRAECPGPEELVRPEQSIDGHAVTLGDGRSWIIPVIRFIDGRTSLPRVLVEDEHGNVKWETKKEFRPLVIAAETILRTLLSEAESVYTPADLLWFASTALSVNYLVGPKEVAALELIDSNNVKSIANAALDGPNLELMLDELRKKKEVPACGMASPAGAGA